VESQKDGADQNAKRASQRRVAEREAKARTDKADRNREEMEIAQKPKRALISNQPMALALRNVVNRVLLNTADGLAPVRLAWARLSGCCASA
jgi:hypothetical protein